VWLGEVDALVLSAARGGVAVPGAEAAGQQGFGGGGRGEEEEAEEEKRRGGEAEWGGGLQQLQQSAAAPAPPLRASPLELEKLVKELLRQPGLVPGAEARTALVEARLRPDPWALAK